ncbi:hypothetical protein DFH08DRAFT_662237, partial [Mycena albidolilacea]
YSIGFSERFMTKVHGAQAQYAVWLAGAMGIVCRPNAVAFIAEGGIVLEIAQVLDPTLIQCFVRGPSLQVTEFLKGNKFLQKNPPNREGRRFYTADSVSEAEILILLGYLPGKDNDKDYSLFPTPKTFDNHYRGMVGVGAAQLIKNMLKKAECDPKWLTEAQWKAYLCPNNFGSYAPTHVPSIEDFNLVGEKIWHVFPINW